MRINNRLRAILIVVFCLAAFDFAARQLQLPNFRPLQELEAEAPIQSANSSPQSNSPTKGLIEAAVLRQNITERLEAVKIPRRRFWAVPLGLPLHEYAWQVQQMVNRSGCQILRSLEISTKAPRRIYMSFACSTNDSSYITLIHDKKRRLPNSAQLAIVFTVDSLNNKALSTLTQIKTPISYLVSALDYKKSLEKDLDRGPAYELAFDFPMEQKLRTRLNYQDLTLKIHHNTQDIKERFDAASSKTSQNIRSLRVQGGELFLQSPNSIDSLLSSMQGHFKSLLIPNKLPLEYDWREKCQTYKIHCEKVRSRKGTIDEFRRAFRNARIYGRKILVLPLSAKTLAFADSLAQSPIANGISFKTLSQLD